MGDQRKSLLVSSFQRGSLLSLRTPFYRDWIERFIVDEIQADVGKIGDITSKAVISGKPKMKAAILTRQDGIVAGIEEACFLYSRNGLSPVALKKDGDIIKKGEFVLEITGDVRELLRVERSAVDLLQRMSGIATLTKKVITMIGNRVPIAPTRKTQWRYLDKKAVYIGGGLTHRLALWESILIKDNHLKALEKQGITDPIETALARAWKQKQNSIFVEIEVTTTEEAIRAGNAINRLRKSGDAAFIMLDNMPPKEIQRTVLKMRSMRLLDHIFIEASGGITPSNIKKFAACPVDVISMGFLTHSAPALDMCQLII